MLKIHTIEGDTFRVDLSDESQAREWLPMLERADFQSRITGVSLVENHVVNCRCAVCDNEVSKRIGVQYSISRPKSGRSIKYEIERIPPSGAVKGGEKVDLFVDEIRLTLVAHAAQPSARITVNHLGKRRHSPKRKFPIHKDKL